MDRLRSRITEPHNQLTSQIQLLRRLHTTCEVLRRIIRFLTFSDKLREQIANGPKDITNAAKSLKELDETMRDFDFSGINVLEANTRFLKRARADVEKQSFLMLERGLESKNHSQVQTSIQVFFNLGQMGENVDKMRENMLKKIRATLKTALDVNSLTESDASSKKGPGRALMPTTGQTAQFRSNLWTAYEKLMEQILEVCTKWHTLYKVLSNKRDAVSYVCFLDEYLKGKDVGNLFDLVWRPITDLLKSDFNQAVKDSPFIRQALEIDYPKLVRLHGDLWKKVEHLKNELRIKIEKVTEEVSSIIL